MCVIIKMRREGKIMALINCPECNREISDQVRRCPGCGYKIKRKDNTIIKILISIVVILMLICLVIIITKIAVNKKRTNSTSVISETGFAEDEKKAKSFSKNSNVVADKCNFTLKGYSIDSKIEPVNASNNYYHYFEASSGNVYIDVKFSIKNTSNTAVIQSNILKRVKIIYDNKYEYNCSFVTIDNNGDFKSYTNLYNINALETMEYHMLAQLPREAQNSGKALKVLVYSGDNIYECVLR